jgi:uncharacterized Tic20 family protein
MSRVPAVTGEPAERESPESGAKRRHQMERSTMKTCASCGATGNPADARFCASCGTPMVGPAAPPEPEPDAGGEADDAAGYASLSAPADWPDAPAWYDAPNREARYWAIAAHATALLGGFMGGVPAFLGPLIVWLVRKDEDAWSAGHGRNALNFNLSVLAYGLGLLVISLVTFGIGLLIAIPGWIFLALGWFALTIVGAIKAANDQPWRYPLTIRFVK